MKIGILIALLLVSYVFTFGSVLFGRKNYIYRTQEEFSFRSVFPCEMNITERFEDNLFGNFFYIVSCLISIAFLCTYVPQYDGIFLPILIIGILTSILNFMIQIVPLKSLKQHILYVSAGFTCSLVLYVAFVVSLIFEFLVNKNNIMFVLIILGTLVFFLFIICLILSKLSFSIKRENVDGKYVKKKIYWIIISEWVCIAFFEFIKLLMLFDFVIVNYL